MARYRYYTRDQAFLLPQDMRDWVPEDDLAHFVIEACERVDLSAFDTRLSNAGVEAYHPQMMLALLVYAYTTGLFSSRKIERATYRDIGVRYVAAGQHPDHNTIAIFRRRNGEAIKAAFLHIVHLARQIGMLKVGTVSVDGTKIKANASKLKSVRYDRAMALSAELEAEIAGLLEKAERADQDKIDDPKLPKTLARRQALKDKLDAAVAYLETEAAEQAEAARPAYEAKKDAWDKKAAKRQARGTASKAPDPKPRGSQIVNLTDHDAKGIKPLVAITGGSPQRPFDLRPPPEEPGKPQRAINAQWRKDMFKTLEDPDNKIEYAKRKQTVEPVFGIIKSAMGFTHFLTRGLQNVKIEWNLIATAYNIKRLHKLNLAA